MAKPVRSSPSVKEGDDWRANENWRNSVTRSLSLVGTRNPGIFTIAPGGRQIFTIPVTGCRAGEQQTVQLALPVSFNVGLIPVGYVSADNTVTILITNPTGASITQPADIFGARVMP